MSLDRTGAEQADRLHRFGHTADEWVWVGLAEGVDEQGDRRGHWRRFSPFGVWRRAGEIQAWVTLAQAKPLFSSGRYAQRVEGNPLLRWPDELVAATTPLQLEAPLTELRFEEAALICHLLGGRLAEEGEVERIAALDGGVNWPAGAIWTATPYSRFSYDWCAYDPRQQRWFAAAHRRLPDIARPGADPMSEQISLFHWDPNRRALRRSGGFKAATASAERPMALAAACLVFDLADELAE